MLTLDADLSMLNLGTGTEFRMGVLRLVFPGESWCSIARDTAAWCHQPLCIAKEEKSVAIAIRTSNGEEFSPVLSLQQQRVAISYSVIPFLTPFYKNFNNPLK